METSNIDLSKCKRGDILLTSQKTVLRYVRPAREKEYLEHVIEYIFDSNNVRYPKGIFATRTNDGHSHKYRIEEKFSHNIIEIIHL